MKNPTTQSFLLLLIPMVLGGCVMSANTTNVSVNCHGESHNVPTIKTKVVVSDHGEHLDKCTAEFYLNDSHNSGERDVDTTTFTFAKGEQDWAVYVWGPKGSTLALSKVFTIKAGTMPPAEYCVDLTDSKRTDARKRKQ